MTLNLKLPTLDPNWVLLLKNAWSMRLILSASVTAVITAIQTGDPFAIVTAVLALCGALSRIVVQPALRAELAQAQECVSRLG